MRRRAMAWALFIAAAFAALIPQTQDAARRTSDFPGWPAEFEGRSLVEDATEGAEALFGERFPGRIGRFRAGWTGQRCSPTRNVSPARAARTRAMNVRS